jgi:hypothetical protein
LRPRRRKRSGASRKRGDAIKAACRIARRRRLAQKRLQERDALRGHAAFGHRGPDRTIGLANVAAVAKAAMRNELAQVDEGAGDHFLRAVRETKHFHARRVDDPAIIAGQAVQHCRGRRVPAASQRLRQLAGARVGPGQQRVDQRRLAHPGLTDDHAVLAA